ncbi:MAG TPA: hypothetical protein VD769_09755 [Gaiellaceae bacterium]|nr:hypothetical protein [Gaiellaceae bacterium]
MAAVAVAERVLASLLGRVVLSRRVVAFLGERIVDVSRRRAPRSRSAGSKVTVAVWATGFASTAATPGRRARTRSTTLFSEA